MTKYPVPDRATTKGSSSNRQVVVRRSPLPLILAIAGILVLIAVAALLLRKPATTTTAPTNDRAVEPFASDTTQGRKHVDKTAVQYNSNPPAGGDHWGNTASWGIQTQAPPDESLVHNLEHGGVIVWYDPAKVDAATITKLGTVVRSLQSTNFRVILTARAKGIEGGKPLAVSSWGHVLLLDTYDEAQIRGFFQAHIGKGPECTKGNCPD
ncbi:MAG: hypothetical protein NVSMB42_22510 [Herpetosiphon sp.]